LWYAASFSEIAAAEAEQDSAVPGFIRNPIRR
jgi:hypothetical protein